jgi:hypothetical protein
MAIVALTALRHALNSGRIDSGLKLEDEFYHLGAPATAETIFLASNIQATQFMLK